MRQRRETPVPLSVSASAPPPPPGRATRSPAPLSRRHRCAEAKKDVRPRPRRDGNLLRRLCRRPEFPDSRHLLPPPAPAARAALGVSRPWAVGVSAALEPLRAPSALDHPSPPTVGGTLLGLSRTVSPNRRERFFAAFRPVPACGPLPGWWRSGPADSGVPPPTPASPGPAVQALTLLPFFFPLFPVCRSL